MKASQGLPRSETFRSAAGDRAAFRAMLSPADREMLDVYLKLSLARAPELARLPKEDLLAVISYTGQQNEGFDVDFASINRALASGDQAELRRLGPVIRCLLSALNQLPRAGGIVVRMKELSPQRLEKYQVGSVVTEPAFLSTCSIDASIYDRKNLYNGPPTNTRFNILCGGEGRYISAASVRPDEREVLFPPGTRFQVVNRHFDASNRQTVVSMRQLPRAT